MTFNLFVLPFSMGLIFVLIAIGNRFYRWIKALNPEDKYKFFRGFRSTALLSALKEIFMESLLHRKMFKNNGFLVICT